LNQAFRGLNPLDDGISSALFSNNNIEGASFVSNDTVAEKLENAT
jgi:hypothetical protein